MSSTKPARRRSPIEIRVEPARKLIRMHFHDRVRPADVEAAADRLRDALCDAGPHAVLITDLTDLEEMDLECAPFLARNMDLCLAAGLARIVRVIPHPAKDIGFRLLSLTHYRGRVSISTFATVAEAERAISTPTAAR